METSRDDFVIAIRSAFLKKGAQQRFSILGLIAFSIVFLVLGNFNYKIIDNVKKVIKEIVYRSSFIVSIPENFLKNTYSDTIYHFSHYELHLKMKDELYELRSKDLNNKINILENIKYKRLIDNYFIKDNETFAKVLIDKQSPFLKSIVINKGSKNNIKLGMIVLDESYLVGKVVEVNYLTSRVLLISDINSKIPVSLQPGDVQAIMSGRGKTQGVVQYTKNINLKDKKEELLVTTSGAGGLFISGIPVGKIRAEETTSNDNDKIVDFYKDFSQLEYVKVISYSKDPVSLDLMSKEDSKQIDEEIKETSQNQEAMRILLEQKKIADEIRIKIGEENVNLKKNIVRLEKEVSSLKKNVKGQELQDEEIKFLRLNLLHSDKCKKSFLKSNLYKVGTPEYRNCILSKGQKN
ncbi:rod shape-determining protein MreC [Candidatus Pelagibacter sp.]|nr:rod shape-determining protein MreC [Candidatus Pelagibacter sp.]